MYHEMVKDYIYDICTQMKIPILLFCGHVLVSQMLNMGKRFMDVLKLGFDSFVLVDTALLEMYYWSCGEFENEQELVVKESQHGIWIIGII